MRFVCVGAAAAIFLLHCCGEEAAVYQSIYAPTLACGHELLFKILYHEAKHTTISFPVAMWLPCAKRMCAQTREGVFTRGDKLALVQMFNK